VSAQPQRLVAALDLGSTKVVALIAEVTGNPRDAGARILGVGVERSNGSRRGVVRDSDLDLFGRIDAAWRVGPDVVLEVDGRRLWFGARASAEDIRAVMAVAQALARQGRAYQELDGRFAGQVIVRGARA